ncbi:MAG: cyclic peptide export ABC transporter [Aestuariibacter sp.]
MTQKITLFAEYAKRAPNKLTASLLIGVASGFCYAALIPLVLNSIAPEDPRFSEQYQDVGHFLGFEVSDYKFATIFMTLCLFILIFRTASQIIMTHITMDLAQFLRRTIYETVIKAKIEDVERIGTPRLSTGITADIPKVITGSSMIPDLLINTVTITGMMGFLFYLNNDVFWLVGICILFGIVSFQLIITIGNHFLVKARNSFDVLIGSINNLIQGVKELKLHHEKRQYFLEDLLVENESSLLRQSKMAHAMHRIAVNYGEIINFGVIGVVAYIVVNYHSISTEELIGLIMALLYVTSPLGVILQSIPQIVAAKISLNKINALTAELPQENLAQELREVPEWDRVILSDITYQFGDGDFTLGPVSLEIPRGEITFIIGGNGSGKSTLGKVISQLYTPSSGQLYFSKQLVTADNILSYRNLVSAIFADYHLFDRLLIDVDAQKEQLTQDLLKKLHLSEKVKVQNNTFSTLSLSQGQKKRIALLVSFLDDRELFIYDEWAADQDPVYKNVFYKDIIPSLKAQGKTVVIISHDDRYFDVADNIIVMEEGKVSSIQQSDLQTKTVA